MSNNLTAGYLADLLKDLPADTPLFVRGFEGGVHYVTSVEARKVRLFANDKWHDGQHQTDEEGDCEGVEIVGQRIPNPNKEMSN